MGWKYAKILPSGKQGREIYHHRRPQKAKRKQKGARIDRRRGAGIRRGGRLRQSMPSNSRAAGSQLRKSTSGSSIVERLGIGPFGIEEMADIIDADDAGHLDHTGFGIHLDLNKVRLPRQRLKKPLLPSVKYHLIGTWGIICIGGSIVNSSFLNP